MPGSDRRRPARSGSARRASPARAGSIGRSPSGWQGRPPSGPHRVRETHHDSPCAERVLSFYCEQRSRSRCDPGGSLETQFPSGFARGSQGEPEGLFIVMSGIGSHPERSLVARDDLIKQRPRIFGVGCPDPIRTTLVDLIGHCTARSVPRSDRMRVWLIDPALYFRIDVLFRSRLSLGPEWDRTPRSSTLRDMLPPTRRASPGCPWPLRRKRVRHTESCPRRSEAPTPESSTWRDAIPARPGRPETLQRNSNIGDQSAPPRLGALKARSRSVRSRNTTFPILPKASGPDAAAPPRVMMVSSEGTGASVQRDGGHAVLGGRFAGPQKRQEDQTYNQGARLMSSFWVIRISPPAQGVPASHWRNRSRSRGSRPARPPRLESASHDPRSGLPGRWPGRRPAPPARSVVLPARR
jgi:hypothetical protein